MVAINVLYDVGSKDEDRNRTGFAHLFEHLMFGGSANIPDFDGPIQLAGGENNAFTNTDITNFYDLLPAQNIETGLWLESDRMMQLDFSEKALNVQKKVVVEEFKETCLNVPYGDLWHHLSALAYKDHPYQWPTIGRIPEHIQEAQLDDVKSFFNRFYCPQNAILVIAGNVVPNDAYRLTEKWFSQIEPGPKNIRNLPQEKIQTEYRFRKVNADVPLPMITLGFHMPDRLHPDYYVYDLLSDVLANGVSSRFYRRLVMDNPIFSDLDAFITGTNEAGLFVITGKPLPDKNIADIKKLLWKELHDLQDIKIEDRELQKLKNKAESNLVLSEISILHKAMSLAYFEMLGDVEEINRESEKYQQITIEDIQRVARLTFRKENCSEVMYLPASDTQKE
jgi:predicted Zn-dependent peptidase